MQFFDEKDKTDSNSNRNHYQSVFYDFSTYPIQNITDFWLIRYINRMRLTIFFYGNGGTLNVLVEMLEFYHNNNEDNYRRINEIKTLWVRILKENLPNYYYYSMHHRCEIYFDGRTRINGQPGGYIHEANLYNTQIQQSTYKYITPKENEKLIRARVAACESEKSLKRMLKRKEILKKSIEEYEHKRRKKLLAEQKIKKMEIEDETSEKTKKSNGIFEIGIN